MAFLSSEIRVVMYTRHVSTTSEVCRATIEFHEPKQGN